MEDHLNNLWQGRTGSLTKLLQDIEVTLGEDRLEDQVPLIVCELLEDTARVLLSLQAEHFAW